MEPGIPAAELQFCRACEESGADGSRVSVFVGAGQEGTGQVEVIEEE